jgi:hypothetical protein
MACSPHLNVELSTHNTVMRTIWINDYIVVTSDVNQYYLHTFVCLEEDANLLVLIKLNLAN